MANWVRQVPVSVDLESLSPFCALVTGEVAAEGSAVEIDAAVDEGLAGETGATADDSSEEIDPGLEEASA